MAKRMVLEDLSPPVNFTCVSSKTVKTITIEPFRAKAFPIIKDLMVDRSSLDRIIQSGGFVSVNTAGNQPDANAIPIEKADADAAFDAATCIGCGACVCNLQERLCHALCRSQG